MNNNSVDYILALKRIAYNNISKELDTVEDFHEFIKKWWLRKYKMPKTDQRFLDMTIDDMIIEYYEDCFIDDPQLAKVYGMGYNSIEELEKERLKKELGDDFKEEVDYFIKPTETEIGSKVEEEVIEKFDIIGE